MATIENLANAKVCVSTFKTPSNWVWLKLADFENAEEFICTALWKLGADSNTELDYPDYSDIDTAMLNDLQKYFELEKKFKELDETEQEALTAWLNNDISIFNDNDAEDIVEKFRDEYQGHYYSKVDFAEQLADELYLPDMPEMAQIYFDYEKFSRDLFCGDYYFLDGGFVFRAC